MARRHPRSCRVCGAHDSRVPISATGLCPDHSRMRLEQNLRGLIEHRGPAFDRWRRACLRAFGGGDLDSDRLAE